MVKFQTYYVREYVDKPQHFDPNSSLTDQDYKLHTDIDYLLAHMAGHSRTPIFGMQETMTFEDWSNEMALVKRRFLSLSPEKQREFGDAQTFLKWCSDPNNYVDKLRCVVEGKKMIEEENYYKEKSDKKAELLAQKLGKVIKGE